jgi:hypothetical protein
MIASRHRVLSCCWSRREAREFPNSLQTATRPWPPSPTQLASSYSRLLCAPRRLVREYAEDTLQRVPERGRDRHLHSNTTLSLIETQTHTVPRTFVPYPQTSTPPRRLSMLANPQWDAHSHRGPCSMATTSWCISISPSLLVPLSPACPVQCAGYSI